MGENGMKLVNTKFTWDASAQKLLLVYEWILVRIEKPDFVYE